MKNNLTTCIYELVKSFGKYKIVPYANENNIEYIFFINDNYHISLLFDDCFYIMIYKDKVRLFGGVYFKNSVLYDNLYKLLYLLRGEKYSNNFPYSTVPSKDVEPHYTFFDNIINHLRNV